MISKVFKPISPGSKAPEETNKSLLLSSFFQTTFYKGHSHNLLIELAISYGIPVVIILFLSITSLLIKSDSYVKISKTIKPIYAKNPYNFVRLYV